MHGWPLSRQPDRMFSSEHAKLHASLSVNGHGWSALLSPSSASRSSSACCERVMAGGACGGRARLVSRRPRDFLLMVHFGQQAYRPHGASPRGRSDRSRLRRREYRARGGDVRVARLPAGSLMVREQVHDLQCGRRRLPAVLHDAHGRHLLAVRVLARRPRAVQAERRPAVRRALPLKPRCAAHVRSSSQRDAVRPVGGAAAAAVRSAVATAVGVAVAAGGGGVV